MWAYGAGLRLRITDDYFAGVAAGRMFRGWYPRDDADDALIASELRGPYLRLFANRRLSRDSALEVSALLCPSGLGGRSAWGLELALALRFSED